MKKIYLFLLLPLLVTPLQSSAWYSPYGYGSYSPVKNSTHILPGYEPRPIKFPSSNYYNNYHRYDTANHSHEKYLQDKIKNFCTPSVYNEERCKRYCNEAKNNNALCGKNKPVMNIAKLEEKRQEEIRRQEEERIRLVEEKKRQELERKEEEIRDNVISIFQTQFEEKNLERIEKINAIENQSSVKAFFLGSSEKSIDELKNEKNKIESQIVKLNEILSETTSDDNKSLIQEKINIFEKQKSFIGKTISENESRNGVFGWAKNIF